MSQLDLFGQPVDAKEPAGSKRSPEAGQERILTGELPDPARDDALIAANVDLDDRCFVIGCGCVAMGAEIDGRPVCGLHDTDVTRAVMATGSWPAWYGYGGKWSVVPTVRRLDDMGHAWAGVLTTEKRCSSCGLSYLAWAKNRFDAPCDDYQQPDTTKGLFRP